MWAMILVLLLVLAVLSIVTVLAYGSHHSKSISRSMRMQLEAARLPTNVEAFDTQELAGLPAPVKRYFQAVLREEQPIVLAVDLEHTGSFNASETTERWRPFVSTQRVITRRPGFDWEARIKMTPGSDKRIRNPYFVMSTPGPAIRVHDAYIAGEGILYVSLFGLVPVTRQRGTPELARGELMRFLAEAAWYPTALLPSQGAQWESIDDVSARVTLTDRETTVSMVFRFGRNDLIESVCSEARGRTVRGEIVPTKWEGRWRGYELCDGMRIPLEGEVSWILPEGRLPYWRGRLTRIRYEFTQGRKPLKSRSDDRLV